MDALGRTLVRADDFVWHLSNVGLGVAVFVATLVYAPPGRHALTLGVVRIDPFYLLVSLAVVYTCWTGVGFWRWYAGLGTDD